MKVGAAKDSSSSGGPLSLMSSISITQGPSSSSSGASGSSHLQLPQPLFPHLSRLHCLIELDVENLEVKIADLSTNGTWLNGRRLPKPIRKDLTKKSSVTGTTKVIPGGDLRAGAAVLLCHGDEITFKAEGSSALVPNPISSSSKSKLTVTGKEDNSNLVNVAEFGFVVNLEMGGG